MCERERERGDYGGDEKRKTGGGGEVNKKYCKLYCFMDKFLCDSHHVRSDFDKQIKKNKLIFLLALGIIQKIRREIKYAGIFFCFYNLSRRFADDLKA